MTTHKSVKKILISQQDVQNRIKELAKQISSDYQNSRPLVVGVLKGAWVYMSDLVRELEIDVDVDFMLVSSYGNSTQSSGEIKILKDLSTDCAGRDVLIVEDIIDSGLTLSRLKDLLIARNANSVKITTILSKPSRRQVNVDVAYVGFEIPDEFVVGYGMDFAEELRGLKDICVLKEEAYQK